MKYLLFILIILISIGCGIDKRYYKLSEPMKEEYMNIYYISSGKELDTFLVLPINEQKAWIEKFWKDRDPVPTTEINEFKEEIKKRVEYANKYFEVKRPKVKGWRTDRGRIFIRHGKPDEEIKRHYVQGLEKQDRMWQGEENIEDHIKRQREFDLYSDYLIWVYKEPKMEFYFHQQGPNYFRLIKEEIEPPYKEAEALYDPKITLKAEHLSANIMLVQWNEKLMLFVNPPRESVKTIETQENQKQAWLELRYLTVAKDVRKTGKISQKPFVHMPIFLITGVEPQENEAIVYVSLTDHLAEETVAWQIKTDKNHTMKDAFFLQGVGFFPNPSALFRHGESLRVAILAPSGDYEVTIDGNAIDSMKKTVTAEEAELPFDLGKASVFKVSLEKLPVDNYRMKIKGHGKEFDMKFKIIPNIAK